MTIPRQDQPPGPTPPPAPTGLTGTAPPGQRVGVWHAAIAGQRVFVPVILVNAGFQSLLVTSDPVPLVSWSFALLAASSVVSLLLTVWLVSCAALAGVDGHPRTPQLLRRPVVLLWAAGAGALAIAVEVIAWWATPLALFVGALVLPPAVAGNRHPLAAALGTVRRHPGHAAVFALGVLLMAVTSWVVALLLGFFVTGAVAAAATWVWLGVVVVLVLCWSCSLYRRGTRSLDLQTAPRDDPPMTA